MENKGKRILMSAFGVIVCGISVGMACAMPVTTEVRICAPFRPTPPFASASRKAEYPSAVPARPAPPLSYRGVITNRLTGFPTHSIFRVSGRYSYSALSRPHCSSVGWHVSSVIPRGAKI